MKNLPDQEAQGVLRRIRAGADIGSIVSHVKAGNLLLQLAVSPETQFRYELPYRPEMPEQIVRDNPYLASMIYESASLYPLARHEPPAIAFPASPHPQEYQSLYLKPFHAAQVVEPLLSDARPSLWTSVCKDDVLMRDLLGVWFRCEYHFTAAFHKDYFLKDMAFEREEFCSSLLVNVTLGYACVRRSRSSSRVLLLTLSTSL